MSNINGVGSTGGINPLQQTKAAAKPAVSTPTRAGDRVELGSVNAAMLAKLKSSSDVRLDKVQDIRAQIEAGTYENDEKLNGAIDKLLDDLV